MGLAAFNRMRKQQEELNKNKISPVTDNDSEKKSLKDMTVDELKLYAEEKGIDLGNSTSQKGILKKIQDAETIE